MKYGWSHTPTPPPSSPPPPPSPHSISPSPAPNPQYLPPKLMTARKDQLACARLRMWGWQGRVFFSIGVGVGGPVGGILAGGHGQAMWEQKWDNQMGKSEYWVWSGGVWQTDYKRFWRLFQRYTGTMCLKHRIHDTHFHVLLTKLLAKEILCNNILTANRAKDYFR